MCVCTDVYVCMYTDVHEYGLTGLPMPHGPLTHLRPTLAPWKRMKTLWSLGETQEQQGHLLMSEHKSLKKKVNQKEKKSKGALSEQT